ncbi:MAG TPA: DUF1453 domain-containing protein [Caulobacteraceae bacterium]|nr:DUF1453 domain-containing protein [Caulobacteraceae bacterium]
MPTDHPGAPLASYLVPLGVAAVIIILRNSRPRRLKIERLWVGPAIYLILMAAALSQAPPPITPVSIAILAGAFALGAAIGWQRGRLTQIHIHPETHDLTSRASPIGLLFIFAILVVRYAARDLLAGNAGTLHLPIVAITDGFLLLAIAMLSVQRLEVWQRATRMLADAKAAAPGPPPPQSIVS